MSTRRALSVAIAAMLSALLCMAVGCGRERGAVEPPTMPATAPPEFDTREPAPQALGLEAYPGARVEGTGDVEGPVGHLLSINFVSTDDYAQVAAFYRAKYPGAIAEETTANGDSVLTLEVSPAPDLRTVTVMKRAVADTVAITLLRHQVK